jgi:hypothetical protein
MTIQADLAARFLDTMTAKLEKGRKAGVDGVRIELADLDLLIKMAEPSAEALDHAMTFMIAALESMTADPDVFAVFGAKLRALSDLRLGIDLASGPDRTVITEMVAKVEIVDGAAIGDREVEDHGAVARGAK